MLKKTRPQVGVLLMDLLIVGFLKIRLLTVGLLQVNKLKDLIMTINKQTVEKVQENL